MARQNPPLLSFNRGLISPKGLARVDLDRTKLSCETMRNWLPSTLGPMSIRPGTKYFGSSRDDTGAEFIEFVASTDDVALPELTEGVMRVWLGEDSHALELLERPAVDTTVSLSDTGWSNTSTGGDASVGSIVDLIPAMTGATTSGVTISASSENTSQSISGANQSAWKAADDDITTAWLDTGNDVSSLPTWWNVDFGAGNTKTVGSYSIRASDEPTSLDNAPRTWGLIGSNFDTGTFATDTGKWTLEDSRANETGWSAGEKRTFSTTTPAAWRHWRLNFTALDGGGALIIREIEMFASTSGQAAFDGGQLVLNATSIGALAKATKRVVVSDTGSEHSLAIEIGRGPITIRVGSTEGDDDYIREASLGTGSHNLAFTPTSNFWITLQSSTQVNRIVSSLSIGPSGPVEVVAPWGRDDLDNIRYDQSADVVYVDCNGVSPKKIERRGTGRSWSVVDYAPNDGPFLAAASTSAKLAPHRYAAGNTILTSDIPFFTPNHVGAIFRLFHEGQDGTWLLGAKDAKTGVVEVTGVADTGTPGTNSERRIEFRVTGTYTGRVTIERSLDGDDRGFKPISTSGNTAVARSSDTGTFTMTIDDPDDNLKVYYRARMGDTGSTLDTGVGAGGYTSGVASVFIDYPGGGRTGLARVIAYNNNQSVDIETLTGFSRKDTGGLTDNWQQGYWSAARGFPTAVSLHGGRLGHAQGGSLFLSIADDYESFDEDVEGDKGPIIRTLGSGPVDRIRYLVSLLRLLIGTSGAELTARASSLDEPLTPANSSTAAVSTQGSANIRALKMDTRALMVQRSGVRVYMVGPAQNTIADYEVFDLTLLVPDLLRAGVRSVAIQRQPDTRLHCVLGDGTVAILTYEPSEEVICWFTWETDGAVERAMVLPGLAEDAVYYHIRRTINGTTRRYLEKWAMESECQGDTGLTWIMDCAKSYTDTGRTAILTGFGHLAGQSVIAWADDTGAATANPHWPDAGKDLSPDVDGVQTTYTVDTGAGTVTLNEAVHHAVVGLPYMADWKYAKLAYAAEIGTALAQMKQAPQMGFVLYQTHNNALSFGPDTGKLDPLPRIIEGARVDQDAIFPTLDKTAVPVPGSFHTDRRLHVRAKAPRPATVLALVPTVVTNER